MSDKTDKCLVCRHAFNGPHSPTLFCGAFWGGGASALKVECESMMKLNKGNCMKFEARRPSQPMLCRVEE